MTRLRWPALLMAALLMAACNRNATPEPQLLPTRTAAPRATAAPEVATAVSGAAAQAAQPTAEPNARPITGLTAANAKDLKPVFVLDEPPAQHIYSVANDRLVIYNDRSFEVVDRESLEAIKRTDVQLQTNRGQGFWYAASANGKFGAIMQPDGTVDIYDLDQGEISTSFKVPAPSFEVASDIALSEDGSELIVVSQGELRRVNVADGKIIGEGQTLPVATNAIRFSEDGSRIAAVQITGEIVIVNAISSDAPITLTEVFTQGAPSTMAFSPNGQKFGAANGSALVVWDLSGDGAKVQERFDGLNGDVDPVFDRSGKYMAAVSGPSVILYDLEKKEGQSEFRLTGSVPVWSANFAPDGSALFIAGSGDLASFRVSDGEPLQSTTRPPLTRASFSPDGRTFATWSATFASPNVAVINTDTGEISNRLTHRSPIRWLTYSPSGKYIASLTLASTVHIWDSQSGAAVVNVTSTQTDTLRALLCFTADETALAFLEDDQIVLQPTATRQAKTSFSLPGRPVALTTCANDKHLLAAASEDSITVLDLKGKQVATIKENVDFADAGALYFNQDGTRLAALNRSQLVVWDVATQNVLQTVQLQREPTLGTFNPVGDKFALNFGDDVDVVDIATGKAVSLDLPKGSIVNAFFPQDPALIITASQIASTESAAATAGQRNYVSGELSIWDAATGKLVRTLKTDEPLLTAEISTDSTHIATSTRNNALAMWAVE